MEQFYCCFLVGDQQSTDSSPGDDDGDDPDDNEGALIMEQFYCCFVVGDQQNTNYFQKYTFDTDIGKPLLNMFISF